MKSVFLSAGHSEVDPGATTYQVRDRGKVLRREADIAVEARNMVAFYLNQSGVKFQVDGSGTVNLPLAQAVIIAKKHPIALEFHCNASDNRLATGSEVLSSAKDKDLAASISRTIATALGIQDRGAKPENAGQHHRLAFIQAGGMIVEMFFLSNPVDLANYDDNKWLMAKAVADVVIRACKD